MLEIIGAIVALGLLITVHETGHFLVARLFGVEIEKFSIGFGPKLISFQGKETNYRISLIPLGGYVKMKGENPDEIVQDAESSFKAKKWWQRALIAFAGPFFNLILASIILIFSFAIGQTFEDQATTIGRILSEDFSELKEGDTIVSVNQNEVESWTQVLRNIKNNSNNEIQVVRDGTALTIQFNSIDEIAFANHVLPHSPPVIGELAIGLPAYKAGLQKQDKILEINDTEIQDWYDIRETIQESETDSANLKIQRENEIFEKKVALERNVLDGTRMLGITQSLPLKIEENFSLKESIQYGLISTINMVYLNYYGLYKLIINPSTIKDNVGGPVMMVTMSRQTIQKGWNSILVFVAMISIVLMVMNLLPIPILDGGHIIFCIIEGITKKPLSIKTQVILQRIGLFILLFLLFFAFINDFNRIFQRNVSIRQHQSQYQE
jgi:regulator of sigma E protease